MAERSDIVVAPQFHAETAAKSLNYAIHSDVGYNRFDGEIFSGVPAPNARLHIAGVGGTGSLVALFNGDNFGVRIWQDAIGSRLEGVDSTGVGAYQPLQLNGSYAVTLCPLGVNADPVAAGGYAFYVATNNAAKPASNLWTISSDRRIKEDIRPYAKGLAEICQLDVVLYKYNGKAGFEKDGKDNVSIIAQDILNVFPECVGKRKRKLEPTDVVETELYDLDAHAINFAVINAVKELKVLHDGSACVLADLGSTVVNHTTVLDDLRTQLTRVTGDLTSLTKRVGSAVNVLAAIDSIVSEHTVALAALQALVAANSSSIPTCFGPPTEAPTDYQGRRALAYDTAANRLYVYNNQWRGITLA